jgi:hypothetical protein
MNELKNPCVCPQTATVSMAVKPRITSHCSCELFWEIACPVWWLLETGLRVPAAIRKAGYIHWQSIGEGQG